MLYVWLLEQPWEPNDDFLKCSKGYFVTAKTYVEYTQPIKPFYFLRE